MKLGLSENRLNPNFNGFSNIRFLIQMAILADINGGDLSGTPKHHDTGHISHTYPRGFIQKSVFDG